MTCILTLPRKPKTLLLCQFLLLFTKISKIPLENFVLKFHLRCSEQWCDIVVSRVSQNSTHSNETQNITIMFDVPSVSSSSLVKSVSCVSCFVSSKLVGSDPFCLFVVLADCCVHIAVAVAVMMWCWCIVNWSTGRIKIDELRLLIFSLVDFNSYRLCKS